MNYRALNRHWLWKRPVRVFGHRFQAPTLDRLASLWLHKVGILGRSEVRLLRRLVSAGMTVLDVGANQGIYTLLLANLARPGPVFAFEPEPMLYQQLVANVRENKADNVVCHPIAISRRSGQLALQPGKMHTGNNRIVKGSSPGSVVVKAASLDELFPDRRIDCIKMDVQGWEAEAFAGGKEMLQRNRDILLIFEFWPYGLRTAGTEPAEFLRFLTHLGFNLWRIKNGALVALEKAGVPDPSRKLDYCDLIATRKPALLSI
jgi:FkbM family methyltransferase